MAGWLDCGGGEAEKMKAEEEREGFDRVFHFVESYSIMDHCVPLPSIRLFGNTHTRARTHTHTHVPHV